MKARCNNMHDRSLGDGVYYDSQDYASFIRRIGVIVIDSVVLVFLSIVLWSTLLVVYDEFGFTDDPVRLFSVLAALGVWLYSVPLKRSRFRTVGYRVLGLMIVATKGGPPSLLTMTFRSLLWLFGPFNFLLDLAWLGADTEGQTLRDCYAGTYVVRNGARPIGTAPMHLTRYNGAGLTLAYPRVCRPSKDSPLAE